MTYCNLQKKYM